MLMKTVPLNTGLNISGMPWIGLSSFWKRAAGMISMLKLGVKSESTTRTTNGPDISGPLAMAPATRTKLQAPSRKLQASSSKLDPGPVLCYRIFKEKEL